MQPDANKKPRFPMRKRGSFHEGDGARTRNHRLDRPVPTIENQLKNDESAESLSESLSGAASDDPDLALVIAAWKSLPEEMRKMITSLVRSTVKAAGG